MSKLIEYKATEAAILELQEKLKALHPSVKQELDLQQELQDFVKSKGIPLRNAALLIYPDLDPKGAAAPRTEQGAATRKARVVKVYQNPHSGEIVETKGGNQKTLKEWKAKYGADVVESWLRK